MNENIINYLQNIKDDVSNILDNTDAVKFNDISNFPNESGIYFIYDQNSNLVYIGAAMNIQKRCKQYIYPKNTGATFRYNLIQKEKKTRKSISAIKKMEKLNSAYANIIKEHYSAKFILVSEDKRTIAYEESVYISAFNLPLNKFNL